MPPIVVALSRANRSSMSSRSMSNQAAVNCVRPPSRYRVLFTTAAAMLTTLTKALGEGRFDDKLKVFTIPRLLIIDEIGYLPIDRQAATLFFQLISRRYERGPMILTSNQSFGSWGDVFGDRVIASAILDRILHHATTISIRGDSYRLKDKLKSGVVKPTTAGA